ncbi:DNA excision repair protein ERCC-8-like [Lingula anatina]|uniref:DNA excision repair protein ERCC-8 n=1 Tax=Lingula anatina TaxID=7574 RepID=A0A1S3IYD2_LINAN|nr:DNA excision repair protein ERCC-8-like [Lingula anatina]|eukprot:XP_013402996.1 DNA excision repair protein ERCC-8-like [Lingula anatina]
MSSLVGYLAYREQGIYPPSFLSRAETVKRAFSLGLSKYKDLEEVHRGGVTSLDIDPAEGRFLLSGSSSGEVVIHDLHNTTGSLKYTFKCVAHVKRPIGRGRQNVSTHAHSGSVETAQWYPLDTGMFLTSGMDSKLKIWDANALVPADSYEFDSSVYCHDMSPIATKHTLVACGIKGRIKLIDLRSGSASHTLQGHRRTVYTLKWSTREPYVLASGGADSRVLLWDIRSAKGSFMKLDQHNGASQSGSSEQTSTAHSGAVNGMCFTSDGLFLVTFGTDERLRLWNTSNGKNTMVNYGKINNENEKSVQVAISNSCDPTLVYVPEFADVAVYDMFSGERYHTLRGHYHQVTSCAVHPNTHDLYSGSLDRNILQWTADRDSVEEALYQHEHPGKDDGGEGKTVGRTSQVNADEWSSDEEELINVPLEQFL